MRSSTGSPIFSDFKLGLSRVVRSRPLVKGNEDAGYEGACLCKNERDVIHSPEPVLSGALKIISFSIRA